MTTTIDFHPTTRVAGATYVMDWTGAIVIGYRDAKTSEAVARGMSSALFTGAETYDLRFTAARAYLAARAARAAVVSNQMELF